jgi:hypothetical protein
MCFIVHFVSSNAYDIICTNLFQKHYCVFLKINISITFIYIKNKVKIVISPEELWYYHCTLNQHLKWYPKTFLMCLLMHDYNTFWLKVILYWFKIINY